MLGQVSKATGDAVMRLSNNCPRLSTVLLPLLLTSCGYNPFHDVGGQGPEKLIVQSDGSMQFRGRPIGAEDVVIYKDGYGGEKAAVRVRMAPLHPDFFRDTIRVERRSDVDDADTTLTQN